MLSQGDKMNSQSVVAKFGGTSVADYTAMYRCAQIINDDPKVKVVVVSASAGVTNHLVELVQQKANHQERLALVDAVMQIQHRILEHVTLDSDLQIGFEETYSEFKEIAMLPALSAQQCDEVLSFGERFSSFIFTQVLRTLGVNSVRFDVRNILKTDSNFSKATPDIEASAAAAAEHLAPLLDNHVVVTQGFIGSDKYGQTTTLGRGGSDYSAALIAEAIDADSVQIWTDVVGIFSTDPRLCTKAKPIPRLSFDEAAEMATFGAKVLHPATILPASRKGISVFVGSSKAPEQGGTWIEKETQAQSGIRAVTQRKNQILLTLKSPEMLLASGFLAKIFTILSNYNISVDLVTTSEISVALTLDNAPNASRPELEQACLDELGEFCHVSVENNLTLVAMIGSEIQLKGGDDCLVDVLSEFDIRLICHGASRHNLCFLVEQASSDQVVQAIHQKLLEAA